MWLAGLALGGLILEWISDTFSIRSSIYFGAIATLIIALIIRIYDKHSTPKAVKDLF